jgi:sec-independent protein translocase protein TatB
MFEVGFTEIILIFGLALLVLGPEKLPSLAAKVGRWTGRARAMARQLRTQLEHEVTMEELAKSRPMQAGPREPAPQPEASAPAAASTPSPDAETHHDPHGSTLEPLPFPDPVSPDPNSKPHSTP